MAMTLIDRFVLLVTCVALWMVVAAGVGLMTRPVVGAFMFGYQAWGD